MTANLESTGGEGKYDLLLGPAYPGLGNFPAKLKMDEDWVIYTVHRYQTI